MRHAKANTTGPIFLVYPKRKSAGHPEAEIYLQCSYDLAKIHKSLGVRVNFDDWDNTARTIKSQPFQNQLLQQKIEEYRHKIMGAYYMLVQNEIQATLREIFDTAFGKEGGKTFSLFSVFEGVIVKMEKQLKPGQTRANLTKHKVCLKHLRAFVKQQYRVNDISFARINRPFIDDFEHYLRVDAANSHNSSNKIMQIFKKIYSIALNNRWTAHNAFAGRKMQYKKVDRPYLTAQELHVIASFTFSSWRLTMIRDCFIFSCYSGLAYIDIFTLQRKHIEFNPYNSQYFIKKNRTKTGIESIIPLFKPAIDVLDKHIPQWRDCHPETVLLPVISNQKYNQYLKEVAAFCGLEKVLTTHVARHTFATTVTLENGVSIESVSKMLGHSKLVQTQHYAKVTEIKIEKDTRALYSMLNQ